MEDETVRVFFFYKNGVRVAFATQVSVEVWEALMEPAGLGLCSTFVMPYIC